MTGRQGLCKALRELLRVLDGADVPTGELHEAAAVPLGEERGGAVQELPAGADAVRHGRVLGRDFRVRLLWKGEVVRVEVADARTERLPVAREPAGEGGRGLLLVAAVSERWGVEPRVGRPYKVVWADVRVIGPAGPRGRRW